MAFEVNRDLSLMNGIRVQSWTITGYRPRVRYRYRPFVGTPVDVPFVPLRLTSYNGIFN